MAQFNMPLHHMPIPDDKYVSSSIERYHGNGMTSPHELGPWLEQSEGGGKFQLKRRRRCGQCGPCQVKDNCNKCQYCLRKDVLKQACVQRKCVYLRKPVPRFQPESGGGEGGGSAVSGGNSSSCSSGSKDSPMKPSPTPSVSNQQSKQSTPVAAPVNPSAVAAAAAVVQSAELSSCQGTQNSFVAPANNSNGGNAVDPRRASALEQHRSALLDATGILEGRPPYAANHRGVETGRSPAQALQQNSNNTNGVLGAGNTAATSPAGSSAKDCPLPPREQFRSPMEQWGAVPYGFPHPNPWAHPALQASQAAAYGFQSSANHYTNPFGSSCQLGMSDPAGPFATASQPSFHHNMPFTHPDFSAHANFHASAPSVQSAMAAPFYPPPHIPPSLPNFPSFSQLPSSTGAPGAYPMAHPPMYPGSFYSSFRPSSEPQIYHVHLTIPDNPFARQEGSSSKCSEAELSDKEEDVNAKKRFSGTDASQCKGVRDMGGYDGSDAMHLSPKAAKCGLLPGDVTNRLLKKIKSKSGSMSFSSLHSDIDEDLQQQLEQVLGRGKCSVIDLEDLKTLAPLRCDEVNSVDADPLDVSLDAVYRKEKVLSYTEEVCDERCNKDKIPEDVEMNRCRQKPGDCGSCRFCGKSHWKLSIQPQQSRDERGLFVKSLPHSQEPVYLPAEMGTVCVAQLQKQTDMQGVIALTGHQEKELFSAVGVASVSQVEQVSVTVTRELADSEIANISTLLQTDQQDDSRNTRTSDPYNISHSISQSGSAALQRESACNTDTGHSENLDQDDLS